VPIGAPELPVVLVRHAASIGGRPLTIYSRTTRMARAAAGSSDSLDAWLGGR
jgi:hypothetical protein